MKNALGHIVGKTITGVIVAENEDNRVQPRHHVFLVFSDDTYFEFFGQDFRCAGGVDPGGYASARLYAELRMNAKVIQEWGKGELR